MPADRLKPSPPRPAAQQQAPRGHAAVHRAVLEALRGADLRRAAERSGMTPADLEAAVEVYHRAGQQALAEQSGWWQANVEFTAWEDADQTAAQRLFPSLYESGAEWWFIRKYPCWRIRLRADSTATRAAVGRTLEELTRGGHLRTWTTGIYEPEVPAFGGPVGMEIAHRLFPADSRSVLEHVSRERGALGRRELSILLCVTLMRAAGLEWFEQADVWDRVCRERPLPEGVSTERLRELAGTVRVLLLADTVREGSMFGSGGPAEHVSAWAQEFRSAGEDLWTSWRSGNLERGLRALVCYHVIFHWNRMGLTSATQSVLAHAAKEAVLETD